MLITVGDSLPLANRDDAIMTTFWNPNWAGCYIYSMS